MADRVGDSGPKRSRQCHGASCEQVSAAGLTHADGECTPGRKWKRRQGWGWGAGRAPCPQCRAHPGGPAPGESPPREAGVTGPYGAEAPGQGLSRPFGPATRDPKGRSPGFGGGENTGASVHGMGGRSGSAPGTLQEPEQLLHICPGNLRAFPGFPAATALCHHGHRHALARTHSHVHTHLLAHTRTCTLTSTTCPCACFLAPLERKSMCSARGRVRTQNDPRHTGAQCACAEAAAGKERPALPPRGPAV